MHIEAELCKRLVDILNGIFTEAGLEIEVDGNWLVDEFGGFKDVDSTGAGSKLYVKVMPRSYPEYTAKTAEMECRIEADFRHDDCPDGEKVNAAYAKLIDLLDRWHDDFEEMKKSLAIQSSPSPSTFTYSSPSPSTFTLKLTKAVSRRWNLMKVTRRGFFSAEPTVKLKPRKPGMMIIVR